jgi:hypothetical protein
MNIDGPSASGLMMSHIRLLFCTECKLAYYEELADTPMPVGLKLVKSGNS